MDGCARPPLVLASLPLLAMLPNNSCGLKTLNEDSEQRMSCSDPEMQHAKTAVSSSTSPKGLSDLDVARALKNVDELFGGGNAREVEQLSETPTESRSRNCSAAKDPLSRHYALGRRRVDSTARPKEFTFTTNEGRQEVFREDQFCDRSFHGQNINTTALRGMRERGDRVRVCWRLVCYVHLHGGIACDVRSSTPRPQKFSP